MPEADYSNPAGRLHAFLIGIKGMASVGNDTPGMNIQGFPQGSNLARLAVLFRLEPTDTGGILSRLGEVSKLPGQIRAAVINTPAISDTFADVLPDAEQYLRSLITTLANQGMPSPQDALLITLKLCSEQLAIHAPELAPSLDDLDSIRIDFETLLNDLIPMNMDEKLKDFIAEEIAKILDAVDRYTISGVSGIRDSLANFFGDLQIFVIQGDVFINGDDTTPFSSRLWSAIDHLASLVGLSVAGTALGQTVIQALSSGHIH